VVVMPAPAMNVEPAMPAVDMEKKENTEPVPVPAR